jgi:serine/threonine protein kinase
VSSKKISLGLCFLLSINLLSACKKNKSSSDSTIEGIQNTEQNIGVLSNDGKRYLTVSKIYLIDPSEPPSTNPPSTSLSLSDLGKLAHTVYTARKSRGKISDEPMKTTSKPDPVLRARVSDPPAPPQSTGARDSDVPRDSDVIDEPIPSIDYSAPAPPTISFKDGTESINLSFSSDVSLITVRSAESIPRATESFVVVSNPHTNAPSIPAAIELAPHVVLKVSTSSSDLVLGKQLGRGAEGTVYEVGDDLAAKVYTNGKATNDQSEVIQNKKITDQNIPSLVKYHGTQTIGDKEVALFEKMQGDLAGAIRERKVEFTPQIMDDLLEGLVALERAGVKMTDIKPDNFLYKTENGKTVVKYSDIGSGATSPGYGAKSGRSSTDTQSVRLLAHSLLELRNGSLLRHASEDLNPTDFIKALELLKQKPGNLSPSVVGKIDDHIADARKHAKIYDDCNKFWDESGNFKLTKEADREAVEALIRSYKPTRAETIIANMRKKTPPYKVEVLEKYALLEKYDFQIDDLYRTNHELLLFAQNRLRRPEPDTYDNLLENMILFKIDKSEDALAAFRRIEK